MDKIKIHIIGKKKILNKIDTKVTQHNLIIISWVNSFILLKI